jgi:menaquinone-specific isochorismate synthase
MMKGLHVCSRPLTTALDLNAVCRGDGHLFVRDGIGVAGRGVATTCSQADVEEVLRGVSAVDEGTDAACGVVAFGIKPFSRESHARFLIPEVLVQKRDDGSQTVSLIGTDPHLVTESRLLAVVNDMASTKPNPPSVNSFAVEPLTSIDTYLSAVVAARDAVRRGEIDKAVIARDIQVRSAQPLDVYSILLRLRASFGSSYRFLVGGLLGASPELLVERHGRTIRSHPLAGTAPRTGDPTTDARLASELVASTKNRIEHRVVIDMVHDTLLPHCSYLDWEPEPSIVTVANVQHLGTALEGALVEPPLSVLALVEMLCPTPALGGHPTKEAMELITKVEGMDRGDYGGAVGWIDGRGDGTWAVTIRCAELSADRTRARLFAGGGIVADSEPHSELAETQAKFQAMLSAIVRP